MSRSQIAEAIERNQPFSIKMADGKEYPVPHRDYIIVSRKGSFVIVIDDEDHTTILPMLTMTGLSYSGDSASKAG